MTSSSSSTNRTEDILVARAEQDLEAGLQYKVERIRASGHPIFAGALEAALHGAVRAIRLRQQFRDDVRFLCGLARRANAGEDPRALAEEHVARALRLKELALVVREKEPAFQDVLAMAKDILAKRLPDLGRMVAVEDPKDYDDLVRKAFPDRAHVDRILEENRVAVLAIVRHAAKHPELLRLPRGMVPKVEELGVDIVEWQTARVKKGVDEIYAAPT